MMRSWRVKWLLQAMSLVLAITTVQPVRASAEPEPGPGPEVQAGPSVAGGPVAVAPKPGDPAADAALRSAPAVAWPAAGDRTVIAGPARATVRTLDPADARKAGVNGLLLLVERLDRTLGRAVIPLDIDYSSFRYAFGGDYASRLALMSLPACALADPRPVRCHGATPVTFVNDVPAGRITAQLEFDPVGQPAHGPIAGLETQLSVPSMLLALTSTSGGSAGDFRSTSLQASSEWSVGLQSGDFTWGYPIEVPEMPGGQPSVGLAYSSGGTDGRTAATNNQVSWIGEGFDYQPGFIERRYQSCADDGRPGSGDLCWASENAILYLSGGGGELVRDDASGVWRAENDESFLVERLTGADGREYWVVTDDDGTRYHFGSRPTAKSAWTVPVFGDDAGEPCHQSTFEASWCQQVYRWSLDYVIDAHGDVTIYTYETEANQYGRNNSPSAVTPYVRGGYLSRIDYGLREPLGTAQARVLFTAADRCIPGSACAQPADFPDVPLDLQCDGGSCLAHAPVFFSGKRLAKITTQVFTGGDYRDADSWALTHTFPATGDGESPTLWLESIVHTGHSGRTPISLPEVNFDGVSLPNRPEPGAYGPMWKWRVNRISNETGGHIEVTYDTADCARVEPDANDQKCFPAYWTPEGQVAPQLEFFYKYVVTEVKEVDRVGGNPAVIHKYEYVGGAAWHYDDAELVAESRKTYGQLRGFQTVRVRTGDSTAGTQTLTEHLFLRGMDGDRLSNGTRRSVQVSDSRGGTLTDSAHLRGFARETRVFNGPGGAWVSTTINEPWSYGPTARRVRSAGPLEAYVTDLKVSKTWAALADGGVEATEERRAFDNLGRPVEVEDLGDVSSAADDTCTRYAYTQNAQRWIMNTVKSVETVGVACTATATDADVLSEQRIYYDGSDSLDAEPTTGNPTRTEELAKIEGGVRTFAPTGRFGYDLHGRPVEAFDPSGDRFTMSYTPATGGPVTAATQRNPLGHNSTTTLDGFGNTLAVTDPNGLRTEYSVDALGRVTEAWAPGRRKGIDSPNATFQYLVRTDGPSVITARALQANGSYVTSHVLHDGLLRERQTQEPAPGGGRIVTDAWHDSHGRVSKVNEPYHNTASPGTGLLGVTDSAVFGQTRYVYDGAGRETDEIFLASGVEKWRTTTTYGGNWVAVTPPTGGTPTMERFDAGDQKVELRQYKGTTPTGAYDSTRYAYTKDGQIDTVTDAAGNVWRHHYDLRGREIRTEDPSSGVSTATFDDEDRMLSSTDARGRTLTYRYDAIGRQTGLFEGSTQLASWEFDRPGLTGGIGKLASSTRFVNGNAYRQEVLGFDAGGRPTGTAVVIPAAEGALAGRYEMALGYNSIGQPSTVTLPGVGGLPAETLTTGYTNLGLPAGLSSDVAAYATIGYDRLGRSNLLALGSTGKQVLQSFIYDNGTGRMTRAITTRQGATPGAVADLNYTYDNFGNIRKMADTPSGQANLADVQCFQYDYLQRLTEAWTATDNCAAAPSTAVTGGPAPYWHSYTYDAAGNRKSEIRHSATGDVVRQYNVTGNKLDSVSQGARTDSFAYDADGNMTRRTVNGVTQTLSWDAEGQLESVAQGEDSTSYVYDADGNRLIRRDPSGTTLYLGATELKAMGTLVEGIRYYTAGERTVAVRRGLELTWLSGSHQGTSGHAINASTLAVERRYSTPFGESRGTPPAAWVGEKGFVGGTNDPSTGLVHLGAREYDPAIGRFISVDPIIDFGDPQQMHGYAYADNSPVTKSDPDGLRPDCGNAACNAAIQKTHKYNGKKYVKKPKPKAKPKKTTPNKATRPRVDKEDQAYGKRNVADEKSRAKARKAAADKKRAAELAARAARGRVDKEDQIYGARNRENEKIKNAKKTKKPAESPNWKTKKGEAYGVCMGTIGSAAKCSYIKNEPESKSKEIGHSYAKLKGCVLACAQTVNDDDGWHFKSDGEHGIGKPDIRDLKGLKKGAMGSASIGTYTATDRVSTFGGCFYRGVGGCYSFGGDSKGGIWHGFEFGIGWGVSLEVIYR